MTETVIFDVKISATKRMYNNSKFDKFVGIRKISKEEAFDELLRTFLAPLRCDYVGYSAEGDYYQFYVEV